MPLLKKSSQDVGNVKFPAPNWMSIHHFISIERISVYFSLLKTSFKSNNRDAIPCHCQRKNTYFSAHIKRKQTEMFCFCRLYLLIIIIITNTPNKTFCKYKIDFWSVKGKYRMNRQHFRMSFPFYYFFSNLYRLFFLKYKKSFYCEC